MQKRSGWHLRWRCFCVATVALATTSQLWETDLDEFVATRLCSQRTRMPHMDLRASMGKSISSGVIWGFFNNKKLLIITLFLSQRNAKTRGVEPKENWVKMEENSKMKGFPKSVNKNYSVFGQPKKKQAKCQHMGDRDIQVGLFFKKKLPAKITRCVHMWCT